MKITYKDKTFNVEPNTRIKDVLKKEIWCNARERINF